MTAYHVCACGRSHTREQWGELEYVGPMDDGVDEIEMRNCECNSTVAVVVRASSTATTIPAAA